MSGELCDVCKKGVTKAVISMPYVPISFAYCESCIAADAHPFWAVAAQTCLAGGLENTIDEWKELVSATLKHLGKSEDDLRAEVQRFQDKLDKYHAGQK